MDTYGSSLGSILAPMLLGRPLYPVTLTHFLKMQPPAGDHVGRDGRREAEKKRREGGREGAKPDWMVAAARSRALAGQTWLF